MTPNAPYALDQSRRLVQVLKYYNLDANDLARLTGWRKHMIAGIMAGNWSASVPFADAISRIFGAEDANYIFGTEAV